MYTEHLYSHSSSERVFPVLKRSESSFHLLPSKIIPDQYKEWETKHKLHFPGNYEIPANLNQNKSSEAGWRHFKWFSSGSSQHAQGGLGWGAERKTVWDRQVAILCNFFHQITPKPGLALRLILKNTTWRKWWDSVPRLCLWRETAAPTLTPTECRKEPSPALPEDRRLHRTRRRVEPFSPAEAPQASQSANCQTRVRGHPNQPPHRTVTNQKSSLF